ncbi:MAG: hypothetical protein KA205_07530 [Acidobacteria bacterium]|nr:hypothetical protein [Acidobacteriota bacterium]
MRPISILITAAFVVAALSPNSLYAQTPSPSRPAAAVDVRSQLGASINNAGLQQSFDASWRRASGASPRPLFADAHIAFGGTLAVTPTAVRGGGWLEVAPLSIVTLRVGADSSQYFGSFDAITSLEQRTDAFDPDARKARGNAKAGRTMRLYATPSVQARVGRIAVASSLAMEWWASSAPGPLFYEPTRDTVLAVGGDRLMTLNTVMLFEHATDGGGKRSAGPIHTLTRVHGGALNQQQRIGVLLTQQSVGRHLGLMRPSVTALVGYYLDDPNKKGQWTAAASVAFSVGRRR